MLAWTLYYVELFDYYLVFVLFAAGWYINLVIVAAIARNLFGMGESADERLPIRLGL